MQSSLRILAVAALAAVTSMSVLAQTRSPLVVDGNDWTNSSARERQAFLVGVANMIIAETAGARAAKRPVSPVADGITKGVSDLSLPQIEGRITQWYRANPSRMATPVMTVIWQDMVRK